MISRIAFTGAEFCHLSLAIQKSLQHKDLSSMHMNEHIAANFNAINQPSLLCILVGFIQPFIPGLVCIHNDLLQEA